MRTKDTENKGPEEANSKLKITESALKLSKSLSLAINEKEGLSKQVKELSS